MTRVKLALNGPWEFVPDPKEQFRPDGLPAKMEEIQVPGSWEAQFPAQAGVFGRGWYRRRARVPPEWRDRTVTLHFGAVNYYCQVWVNGHFAGDHEGGYTPFHFRVDRFMGERPELEIVVKVVNAAHATPSFPEFSYQEIAGTLKDMFGVSISEVPLGKQNWYGSVSGIWQDVYLLAVSPTHFTQVLITPDVDHSRALVRVGLHEPPLEAPGMCLEYRILDADGKVAGQRERVPLSEALGESPSPGRAVQSPFVEIPIENPRLWNLSDPHLYRLEVRLMNEGEKDDLSTAFGMRKVSVDRNRIELNDAPIFIIAALDQDFYPETGYTPPSKEFLEDQVEKAKHMGLNLLRCHIKVPDPRYLEVADEKGILVWEELPNWLRLTEESAARGRETITRMIERDFNHPSTIIWTIINESWGADLLRKAWDRRWLKQMYYYVKRLDPTRLVVDNSPCNMPKGRNFHLRTDIEDFHIYFQIPDHLHKWNHWVKDFATHPSWTFSHHGDAERTGEEALMVSEFGNWGLPTLKDLLTEYGEEPTWFRTGVDITIPRGVQRRFERLHLDEIFGSYDQFAIATQWQQYFALKHQVEEMRKYASIAGYCITEFTDLFWEANGLLNIWRRPKVFYHYLQQFQQQDVLLANWSRLNYWEGDLCVVPVVLSHWSALDVSGWTIEWNISELGVSGTIADVSLACAESREIGSVSFVVPSLTEAVRTRLHLRLRDREGRIAAKSIQYLSFFPSAYRKPAKLTGPIWFHDPNNLWEMEEHLSESGYSIVPSPKSQAPSPKSQAPSPESGVPSPKSQVDPGPETLDLKPETLDLEPETLDLKPGTVNLEPRLAVVTRLDEEVVRFLEEGGSVLFLARSPDDVSREITQQTGIRVRDRRVRIDEKTTEKNPWEGDWVSNFSWIKQEPVFERIPRANETPLSGDLMDMQYYRVIPNQVLLGWSQERENPDVHSGMVVGWVHAPVTLMAQCRWGKGKLLATTLKLESGFGDDPVATVLVHNLLGYMASHRFRPQKDAMAPRRPSRAMRSGGRTVSVAEVYRPAGEDGNGGGTPEPLEAEAHPTIESLAEGAERT